MPYIQAMSNCFGCGKLFAYNPDLVPSVRVNANRQPDPHGTREPVCADCVVRVNPKRIANGLQPIRVLPGAYEPQEV